MPENKVFLLNNQQLHTSYIDMATPLTQLQNLETHTTGIAKHLKEGIDHLRTSLASSIEIGLDQYVIIQNVDMKILPTTCEIVGGEQATFTNKTMLELAATKLQEYNAANFGTDLITPKSICIAVRVPPSSNKLIYYGSEEELDMEGTSISNTDLMSTRTACPLLDVATKTLKFRTEDTKVPILCKRDRQDKDNENVKWKRLAKRKLVSISILDKLIKQTQETILKAIPSGTFSYQTGIKAPIMPKLELQDLSKYATDLALHETQNLYKTGGYALAHVFLHDYIEAIRAYHLHIQSELGSAEKVKAKLVSIALTEVIALLSADWDSSSNMGTYLSILKDSLKPKSIQYDANSKVAMVELLYYNIRPETMYHQYEVIHFPFQVGDVFASLEPPTHHILVGKEENYCSFIGDTYVGHNCKNLPDESSILTCTNIHFPPSDSCCVAIAKLDVVNTVHNCTFKETVGTASYKHFIWEQYNALLATQPKNPTKITVACDPTVESYSINETTMISTPCNIMLNGHTYPPTSMDVESTSIMPLTKLFPDMHKLLLGQDTSQIMIVNNTFNHSLTDLTKEIFGPSPYLGIGIFSTVLFTLVCCCCTFSFGLSKLFKGRQINPSDNSNYIMSNQLPPYSPNYNYNPKQPTAPNVQFI